MDLRAFLPCNAVQNSFFLLLAGQKLQEGETADAEGNSPKVSPADFIQLLGVYRPGQDTNAVDPMLSQFHTAI